MACIEVEHAFVTYFIAAHTKPTLLFGLMPRSTMLLAAAQSAAIYITEGPVGYDWRICACIPASRLLPADFACLRLAQLISVVAGVARVAKEGTHSVQSHRTNQNIFIALSPLLSQHPMVKAVSPGLAANKRYNRRKPEKLHTEYASTEEGNRQMVATAEFVSSRLLPAAYLPGSYPARVPMIRGQNA